MPVVPLVTVEPLVPVEPVVLVVPAETVEVPPLSGAEDPVELVTLGVPTELELGDAVEVTEKLEVGAVLVVCVAVRSDGRGLNPTSPILTWVFSMLLAPTAVWVVLPLPVVPVDITLPEPLTVV